MAKLTQIAANTDCAGALTLDHYHPRSQGGTDALDNLIYCCWRCNLCKAEYWPTGENDPLLWNPRIDHASVDFLVLTDATLHPSRQPGGLPSSVSVSPVRRWWPIGVIGKSKPSNLLRLLKQYAEAVAALGHMQRQQTLLLEEQRNLLELQRQLLKMLLPPDT